MHSRNQHQLLIFGSCVDWLVKTGVSHFTGTIIVVKLTLIYSASSSGGRRRRTVDGTHDLLSQGLGIMSKVNGSQENHFETVCTAKVQEVKLTQDQQIDLKVTGTNVLLPPA